MQRQPERAEVMFGGVDAVAAGAPFAMLARAIRRAAGIVDGEPLEARREKLGARGSRATSIARPASASPSSWARSPTSASTRGARRCAPRAAARS